MDHIVYDIIGFDFNIMIHVCWGLLIELEEGLAISTANSQELIYLTVKTFFHMLVHTIFTLLKSESLTYGSIIKRRNLFLLFYFMFSQDIYFFYWIYVVSWRLTCVLKFAHEFRYLYHMFSEVLNTSIVWVFCCCRCVYKELYGWH